MTAKPDAWMPLYIGDWDSGTRHLDCEQDGAYGRLVRHYWKNGPLPDNDGQLARIVGMDLKRWRRTRGVLAAFFVIGDGLWRHRRVDAELVRWEEKRRRAIERAAAGGRAKAAKGGATSTSQARRKQATSTAQALLKGCTSASSRKVEGPNEPSTLSGRAPPAALADGARPAPAWRGPEALRQAIVAKMGEDWAASWLDPCEWDDEAAVILAPRDLTVTHLERSVRRELIDAKVGQVRVRGRAA